MGMSSLCHSGRYSSTNRTPLPHMFQLSLRQGVSGAPITSDSYKLTAVGGNAGEPGGTSMSVRTFDRLDQFRPDEAGGIRPERLGSPNYAAGGSGRCGLA